MVGSFDDYRHPNPRFHVDFPSVSCVMGSNDILVLCRRCGRFAHDATFGFPRPLSFFETQAEMVLLRSTDYAASFSEQTVLYRCLAYDPFICMLDGGRLMAGMVIGQNGARRERNRLDGVLHRHLPDLDAVITIQGIGLWYSDDGGRTWPAEPIMVSVPGWENVYNLRPPVRLRDGTILLPVTIGGVDTREVSSQTMESRRSPGLYFIGEVLDVTGHLGGFNFQWAWASGHAAAQYV